MSTRKAKPDVVVIGGGAAGMMAALFALRGGASVMLLEKNEKLGKKIYITGKGRCNVTNACETQDFLQNVPRNPRFLYSALHTLSTADLMALLESLGCPLKIERGARVFPVSDKASDITRTLDVALSRGGCETRLNTPVKRILALDSVVSGVELESGEIIDASRVIVATGGLSYPSTGSTGDGLKFAKELGHEIVPPLPSLIPLMTKEAWVPKLQGLSLKNVSLTATLGGKTIYSEQGEMLFTHFGISGPLVIELSSHAAGMEYQNMQISIDMKPALTEEQLTLRLQKEFAAGGKKQLHTVLTALLPQRMAELFPEICGIDGQKCVSQISAAQRDKIVQTLKALPVTVIGTRPIAEAIITRGGVNIRSLSASSMESKLIHGLYFAGEVVDVDAHTGGFNLQIAFSTGALAGKSAAESLTT